jgi:hypothetical protein
MSYLKIPLAPFDLARQTRRLTMYAHSRLQSSSAPWDQIYVLNSIVMPTDLDENYHMNNARYLRDAGMYGHVMSCHIE